MSVSPRPGSLRMRAIRAEIMAERNRASVPLIVRAKRIKRLDAVKTSAPSAKAERRDETPQQARQAQQPGETANDSVNRVLALFGSLKGTQAFKEDALVFQQDMREEWR